MRRYTNVRIPAIALLCCSALLSAISCGQDKVNGQTSNEPGRDPKASVSQNSSSRARGDLSDLPGTHWSLMSLTKKGDAEYKSGTWPNLQFCKDGSWAILHYGSIQGGHYQVDGSRLVMKSEDGTLYGDYRFSSRTGKELLLESDDSYVMRLKYLDSQDCSR